MKKDFFQPIIPISNLQIPITKRKQRCTKAFICRSTLMQVKSIHLWSAIWFIYLTMILTCDVLPCQSILVHIVQLYICTNTLLGVRHNRSSDKQDLAVTNWVKLLYWISFKKTLLHTSYLYPLSNPQNGLQCMQSI